MSAVGVVAAHTIRPWYIERYARASRASRLPQAASHRGVACSAPRSAHRGRELHRRMRISSVVKGVSPPRGRLYRALCESRPVQMRARCPAVPSL